MIFFVSSRQNESPVVHVSTRGGIGRHATLSNVFWLLYGLKINHIQFHQNRFDIFLTITIF